MELKLNHDVTIVTDSLPNKDDFVSFVDGLHFQIDHVNMELLLAAIDYNNKGLSFKKLNVQNHIKTPLTNLDNDYVVRVDFEINDQSSSIPLTADEFTAFNSLTLPVHEDFDSISNTKANTAALCAILLAQDFKQKYSLVDIMYNVSLFYSLFSIYIEDSTYTDYNQYLCLSFPKYLGNALFKVRINDVDKSDDTIIKDAIDTLVNAVNLIL